MKIIKYITLLILFLCILSSCKDNVASSIDYQYNKKTKVHSITFPEYNYISPQFFTISIKNIEVNQLDRHISYIVEEKNKNTYRLELLLFSKDSKYPEITHKNSYGTIVYYSNCKILKKQLITYLFAYFFGTLWKRNKYIDSEIGRAHV